MPALVTRHTDGVVLVNVTPRAEEADADIEYGSVPNSLFAGCGKSIVCVVFRATTAVVVSGNPARSPEMVAVPVPREAGAV
jgi:hypothetical protein